MQPTTYNWAVKMCITEFQMGKHRDIVKQAFNVMIQASIALTTKPENIDLDPLGMTWRDRRQAVLDAHKLIRHLFFIGLFNNFNLRIAL